jgi:hypothetical protein
MEPATLQAVAAGCGDPDVRPLAAEGPCARPPLDFALRITADLRIAKLP